MATKKIQPKNPAAKARTTSGSKATSKTTARKTSGFKGKFRKAGRKTSGFRFS